MRSDFVFVEVEGQRIDTWTEYRVESSIKTPADSFSLTIEIGGPDIATELPRLRDLVQPLHEVKLYVGDEITGRARGRYLQLTGRIDKRSVSVSREGARITIEGRDKAAHLVDSATPVGLVQRNTEFFHLARTSVAPWGIEVVSDPTTARDLLTGRTSVMTASRLDVESARAQGIDPSVFDRRTLRRAQRAGVPPDEFVGATPSARGRRLSSSGMTPSDVERQSVRDAAPQVGETVWSFLSRHAERLGMMMWMDPLGRLVIGCPNYSQEPRYRFVRRFVNDPADPNNFESGTVDHDSGEIFSKVTIRGRSRGGRPATDSDNTDGPPPRGTARARIVGVAELDLPFRREHDESDSNVTTQERADRAARRKLREGVLQAETIHISAPDHGLGRYLYAIDTTADVVDEYSGVDGRRYVSSRTFERSRERGTRTELELVQLNSLTI